MPYRGSGNVSVDDFDGYDPTRYSGGYDITLTYGRPLQPSDEICYPVSGTEDVDFERPQYLSGSQTSAYAANPIREGDCYGILLPGFRPPPQPATNTGYPVSGTEDVDFERPQYPYGSQNPAYAPNPIHEGDCYGILRPGFRPPPQPATNTGYPGYQSYGHQGIGGPGFAGVSDYGSEQAQRPQLHEYGSANYGSGYDGRPQLQEYGSEYQSGYGRQEASFGHGPGGYQRSNEEGSGRQGYVGGEYLRSEEAAAATAGGGYRPHGDDVYEGNSSYQRPNYGVGQEQSGWYGNLGHREERSGMYNKPSYTNEEQRVGYKKPSYYGAEQGEEYGSSKYGSDSDEEEKHHHQKHHHRHH